jgi:hypothetical protein
MEKIRRFTEFYLPSILGHGKHSKYLIIKYCTSTYFTQYGTTCVYHNDIRVMMGTMSVFPCSLGDGKRGKLCRHPDHGQLRHNRLAKLKTTIYYVVIGIFFLYRRRSEGPDSGQKWRHDRSLQLRCMYISKKFCIIIYICKLKKWNLSLSRCYWLKFQCR